MSGETLLTAVGLVLVLEGLLPLVAPAAWRAFTQLRCTTGRSALSACWRCWPACCC
jgi:uncharacterized protein YjeT (DUF2065 family)